MPRPSSYLAVLASRRGLMASRGRARRRPPPQLQPDAVRRAYFAELRKVIGRARQLVVQHVVPQLRRLVVQAAAEHGDSAARLDESTGEVNRLIDRVADDWFAEFPNERLARMAEKFGQRTADFQRQQLSKQFQATLGIDVVQAEPWLGRRVGAFAGENVALIKSVAQRHFADLETKLVAGLRSGERWEDLAQMLQARYGVAESSAKLVARDQVGKLFGDLNRVRQQKLGVTSFVWRTMADNRVRDEHELLDGQTFSWDDPPEEGLPGEAIQCRCWGEPLLDEGEGAEGPPEVVGGGAEGGVGEGGGPPAGGGGAGEPPGGAPPAPPRGGGEPPGGQPPGGGGAGGGEGPPAPQFHGGAPPADGPQPFWRMEPGLPGRLVVVPGEHPTAKDTLAAARTLRSRGNDIYLLPEVKGGRMYDAAVNPPGGDLKLNGVELTRIRRSDANAGTVKNTLERKHGRKQGAAQLVVDATGANLSEADATRGVQRAWTNLRGDFSFVRIIGPDFDLTFWKRPSTI